MIFFCLNILVVTEILYQFHSGSPYHRPERADGRHRDLAWKRTTRFRLPRLPRTCPVPGLLGHSFAICTRGTEIVSLH